MRFLFTFVFFVGLWNQHVKAQDTLQHITAEIIPAAGADSSFVKTYSRPNDIRIILGGQGAGLTYQSIHDKEVEWNSETYSNVNDLIGFGLTYKVIDFDLLFTLPNAHVLPDERQNLSQFKLSMSYTGRKNAFRGYFSESNGLISSDPTGNFQSESDIHLLKVGGQITHIFNAERYSYRAANFQSELQTKTAGSFLLRLEPFYREFGVGSALAAPTRNVREIFGDQAGLQYANAPGVLFMPGYSITFVSHEGKFYASPMILLGPGLSVNTYKSDEGKFTSVNFEACGALSLNAGYNGAKMYANFRTSYDLAYTYLNPSLLNTTEIKIYLTVGLRFSHLEKVIPTGFF